MVLKQFCFSFISITRRVFLDIVYRQSAFVVTCAVVNEIRRTTRMALATALSFLSVDIIVPARKIFEAARLLTSAIVKRPLAMFS